MEVVVEEEEEEERGVLLGVTGVPSPPSGPGWYKVDACKTGH